MAGTRSYVRGNNGRFAGAGAGTKVTQGRSGGFANASFRARVAQSRVVRAQPTAAKARTSFTSGAKRIAHSKKVQKGAVQLGVAAGLAIHNRRKNGPIRTGIVPAVKKLVNAAKPAGGATATNDKSPIHVNASGPRRLI